MKRLLAWLAVLLFGQMVWANSTNELALIPLPQKVQPLDGAFVLTLQTRIEADRSSSKTAELLAERLRKSTGYPLKVHWKLSSSAPQPNTIWFTTKNANTNLGAEGYELVVTTNGILIRAPTQAGLFYGSQTLLQLFPSQIFSTNVVVRNWKVPCVQIVDWPRFPWRGLMLDVSRHFYTVAEVKTILDEMALYKLNTFHWHLVDDQGWRIEIKGYPKLTEVGAWRAQSDIDPPPPAPAPEWTKPTADKFRPDGQYGGFYTADDIRDVVAYAAARHITVVPEIEMPGHSVAALGAYPQFSCFGEPYSTNNKMGIHDGIYDPSNPETFKFLDAVLLQVFALFPAQYVHIGGDEVPTNYWQRSASCCALMQREGLTSEEELQSYFIQHMEQFVNAHGKTLVGWSEILKGGLATNAVVMDWIGGGKQAAEAGHDAVMTPIDYCYFDHYHKPRAVGTAVPLKQVYAFEPVPADLPAEYQSHILGAQAVLWTEYIASLPHAQYMLFPRTCALAEDVWSAKDARNWDDFQRRLTVDEKRLDALGVNYHHEGEPPVVR